MLLPLVALVALAPALTLAHMYQGDPSPPPSPPDTPPAPAAKDKKGAQGRGSALGRFGGFFRKGKGKDKDTIGEDDLEEGEDEVRCRLTDWLAGWLTGWLAC